MKVTATRILIVEDNPGDARLLQRYLATTHEFELQCVESLSSAMAALRASYFDAVLLDLSLPDARGLETLRSVRAAAPDLPIVVLTGLDDEAVAIEALRQGAQDYLIKGEIHRHWLARAIHYAIERQHTLEKLQQLNEELIRSNQELEQFASVVSHDLQQPLQGILSCAQMLVRTYQNSSDAKSLAYIEVITKSSLRMRQLMQDLLIYARVGSTKEARMEIDCYRALQIALDNLETEIAAAGAEISVGTLPQLNARSIELVQLFQNLIGNALKYRRPDVPLRIEISARRERDQWLFAVADNGSGIAAADCDRIFKIFQRLPAAAALPGTGVGLAICKKIVEGLRGKIWIRSQLGVGSIFYFALPILAPRHRLSEDITKVES